MSETYWDAAIEDAERQIKRLQIAIEDCKAKKAAGEPWPGEVPLETERLALSPVTPELLQQFVEEANDPTIRLLVTRSGQSIFAMFDRTGSLTIKEIAFVFRRGDRDQPFANDGRMPDADVIEDRGHGWGVGGILLPPDIGIEELAAKVRARISQLQELASVAQ